MHSGCGCCKSNCFQTVDCVWESRCGNSTDLTNSVTTYHTTLGESSCRARDIFRTDGRYRTDEVSNECETDWRDTSKDRHHHSLDFSTGEADHDFSDNSDNLSDRSTGWSGSRPCGSVGGLSESPARSFYVTCKHSYTRHGN